MTTEAATWREIARRLIDEYDQYATNGLCHLIWTLRYKPIGSKSCFARYRLTDRMRSRLREHLDGGAWLIEPTFARRFRFTREEQSTRALFALLLAHIAEEEARP